MSSNSRTMRRIEAAFLLVSMLAMTIWYAWPQMIYSLFIVYDIIRTHFPQFLPAISVFTPRL